LQAALLSHHAYVTTLFSAQPVVVLETSPSKVTTAEKPRPGQNSELHKLMHRPMG
jgi:hypothetical protein